MPFIISVLLLCSGLIGMYLGQRMVRNRYDYFFRRVQPEEIKAGRIVYVCTDDESFHKKTVSDILNIGNDWKAFQTDDGCRYTLGEGVVREDSLRIAMGKETNGKWISRDELNRYEKTFGNPVRQLEKNTQKEEERK